MIGETPAAEPELIPGRVFRVNLMSLTRDMKKQNFIVSFCVREMKGSDALTDLVNYEMTSVNVKRLAKKAKDKIEDSFVCETKDNVKIRVKPLILTRKHTQKGVQDGLRKTARDYIKEQAKELDFSEIVQKIIQTEIQRSIKAKLKKVYPAGLVEIRVLKRVKK